MRRSSNCSSLRRCQGNLIAHGEQILAARLQGVKKGAGADQEQEHRLAGHMKFSFVLLYAAPAPVCY